MATGRWHVVRRSRLSARVGETVEHKAPDGLFWKDGVAVELGGFAVRLAGLEDPPVVSYRPEDTLGVADQAGADAAFKRNVVDLAANSGSACASHLDRSGTPLSEVLGINIDRLATQRNWPPSVPYGLRLRDASGNVNRLALRSRCAHSRRFELCRTLGDIVWSGNDPLGPLSTAKSGRQKSSAPSPRSSCVRSTTCGPTSPARTQPTTTSMRRPAISTSPSA